MCGEELNLEHVVRDLRSKRHGSVQTEVQYAYMHRVLVYLAESKSLVKMEDVRTFLTDYDAYLKAKGFA